MDEAQAWWNSLCADVYARGKDCPGKVWWEAKAGHPAIFRALKLDPADPVSFYAALPFRIARVDGVPVVLIAHPAPLTLGPVDCDWLGIEAVLAWNPVTGAVTVLGDDVPQLFGAVSDDAPNLFGGAFAFFRAWIEARAAFVVHRQNIAANAWTVRPAERSETPGALIVGDAAKVRWRVHALPQNINVVGGDATAINRAILRAAHLPRAVSVTRNLRAAA